MKNAILPLFLLVAIPFGLVAQTATKLRLSDYPVLIANNQPFTVRVDAVDANGQIDQTYNGEGRLDLVFSQGSIDGAAATFENGSALFNVRMAADASANGVGYFTLEATSDGLAADTTATIAMGLNPQTHVNEQFESDLPAWKGINNWMLDESAPINGAKSLKHNRTVTDSSKDTLLFTLSNTLQGQAVEWQVDMRNGNWATSGASNFYMILAASEADVSSKTCYGLAMGTKSKYIELWEFRGSTVTSPSLITTDIEWKKNTNHGLRAALLPNGEVLLWVKQTGTEHWQLAGKSMVNNTIVPAIGGFFFSYAKSYAGQLYIDNVLVRSMEMPSSTPPTPPTPPISTVSNGTWGSLVISEIMPHEKSETLHKRKYVELYNPTAEAIDVTGWQLWRNDKLSTLPAAVIEPGEYAVICFSAAAATNMAAYGKTITVASTAAPLVDGATLKLCTPEGGLVSMVQYAKSWYVPSELANTNSLEVIDLSNLRSEANNWAASTDSKGGTPCAPNSVAASNPDNLPFTVECYAIGANRIGLYFSYIVDTTAAANTAMYAIDNSIGTPSAAKIGANYNEVELTLSSELAESKLYRLTLNDAITCIDGRPLQQREFEIVRPSVVEPNDVIINEILFNAPTGGTKYVELYNRSDRTFDLSTMLLARRSTKDSIDQPYAASVKPHILWPGDYAVISTSSELVQQHYTVRNPAALVEVPKIPTYAQDGGSVILLDTAKRIIDEVRYTAKMHNRLLSNVKGVALERVNPNAPSAEPTSWQSAAATAGFGTPTYRNSQYTDDPTPKAKGAFSLSPETFSPDGDGYNDHLLLTYNLPEPGYMANIRIFSSAGVEVCRLGNNLTLGTEGQLRWDGNNNNGARVPVGIYIVHVEYFLNGKVQHQKLVCTVARK